MNSRLKALKSPCGLLNLFIYGSLLVLLFCLFSTALVFSKMYLEKEQARSDISKDQLIHFFDFQYPKIAEEMWTQSYDAINLRIQEMTKQFGHATHELVLANEQGKCVYSTLNAQGCELPKAFISAMPELKPGSLKPIVFFDDEARHYIYAVSIHVGSAQKGYLYAEVSDPYGFYRGGSLGLVFKIFIIPIFCLTVVWLLWLLVSQRVILRPYLSTLVKLEKKQALGILAAQVAHDIRSPLVALKSVIGTVSNLDESQRKIIVTAGGRIESIANDLITQFTGLANQLPEQTSFLQAVVDGIIAEKRAVLGTDTKIDLSATFLSDFRDAHVALSPSEISRILSNLVNNSIEAVKDRYKGYISIELSSHDGQVFLTIEDNGCGMNTETLHKLKTVGGSYGKIGGTGIGISHAKATLAKIQGSVAINSNSGVGTKITLEMPTASLPIWCAESLDFSEATTIVVLDDDQSMHFMWKQRLQGLNVVYLTDPEQFDLARFPLETTRYIFDHEIRNSPIAGLDLIVSNRLGDRAVLVTSHFADAEIQNSIEASNSKMLPKFAVPTIQIKTREIASAQISSESYDLVLIDDDSLVHDTWSYAAELEGKLLKTVFSHKELDLQSLSKSTPIFIDKNLGDEDGFEVAKGLYENGFSNISIATGDSQNEISIPHFIREVRGKEFPVLDT